MKTGSLALALAVLVTASTALAAGTRLNMKPGLWETTTTTTISGAGMPPGAMSGMPPGALDSLPPAQRAKMMAHFGGGPGKPKAVTKKSCITQKELDDAEYGSSKDPEHPCESKMTKETATHAEGTYACKGNPPATGTIVIDAPSPESTKSEVNTSSGAVKIKIVSKGKWLASDCGKVKPETAAK